MARETAQTKAHRLLAEGRVIVFIADNEIIGALRPRVRDVPSRHLRARRLGVHLRMQKSLLAPVSGDALHISTDG